jgi:G3E family GTPase
MASHPPIPVTVITGFLGAGKTTLIRKLLKAPHGLRIGLVLNEIGQAGIDQVPEANQAYVELTEGCACCVRNPDLIAALSEVGQRDDIDRIVLETSGLADPLPLTWSLTHPELADLVALDAVVVVLDARNYAAAAREEWDAQIRSADLAVLTKEDLAPPEEVAAVRDAALAINPHLRFVDVREDHVADLLLDTAVDSPRARALEKGHAHHSDFGGFILAKVVRYQSVALEDLLEQLPPEVFRAKGIVQLETDEWASFHVVGGRVQMQFDAMTPTHGESRIALFGRPLDGARLADLFAACEHP